MPQRSTCAAEFINHYKGAFGPWNGYYFQYHIELACNEGLALGRELYKLLLLVQVARCIHLFRYF